MPKIHFEIPHPLPAEEAKQRLQRFAEALQSKFQDNVNELDQSWNGNTLGFGFKTFGIKVAGQITVEDQRIVVDGELPVTAMMFKGKIESEMRQQLERLLQ
jgi:hypothetical protein